VTRHLIAAPFLLWLLLSPLPAAAQAEPHAWLFGAWSGGTLPPNRAQSAAACNAVPTVIVTRDIVLRTTLLDPTYQQRIVETVRVTPDGAEIRFRPIPRIPGMFGAQANPGFGCGSPDLLTIRRRGANEIEFPGCLDFPSPLVRCPAQ
jgi:hypothetical protein